MNMNFYTSESWHEIREQAIRIQGTCNNCLSKKNLTVHHKTYENFGGNESAEDLVVLCEKCHKELHSIEEEPWVNIVNSIEHLQKNQQSIPYRFSLPPEAHESPEKRIEKLKEYLEAKKKHLGMKFIIVHNCNCCVNKLESNPFCKKIGQYGCYPTR